MHDLEWFEYHKDPLYFYYQANTTDDDVVFTLKQCVIMDDAIPCELRVYVRGHGLTMNTSASSNPTLMFKGHDPVLTVKADVNECMRLADKIARANTPVKIPNKWHGHKLVINRNRIGYISYIRVVVYDHHTKFTRMQLVVWHRYINLRTFKLENPTTQEWETAV